MPKFDEQVSKREVRELSRDPILAEGLVRVVPISASCSTKEGFPYAISVRLAPLGDPTDASSRKFHLAAFANLPIGRHDESHPAAASYQVQASVDYVLAAYPELPQIPRWADVKDKAAMNAAKDEAVGAAKLKLVQLWNQFEEDEAGLLEELAERPVFCVAKHYVSKKDGSKGVAFRYFSAEANKKMQLLGESEMEFLDLGEDVEPAEDSNEGGRRRRRG